MVNVFTAAKGTIKGLRNHETMFANSFVTDTDHAIRFALIWPSARCAALPDVGGMARSAPSGKAVFGGRMTGEADGCQPFGTSDAGLLSVVCHKSVPGGRIARNRLLECDGQKNRSQADGRLPASHSCRVIESF